MYEKWAEGCDLSGIRHLGQDSWINWSIKVGDTIGALLKESQLKWRKQGAVDKGFDVAMDCRWSSRGFNAEEATVTCCCLKSNKVIYHSNLMRKQEKNSMKRNYVGTSKGMEGEGVARICKQIQQDGYKLNSVSHDNDASSMSQVHSLFPDCVEKLDVGHAAKNICKKVKELAKGGHKTLIGFGEKVKRRFQSLAYSAKGSEEEFIRGLDISIDHWCGDHSQCTHGPLTGKAYQPLQKGSDDVKALRELFEVVKKQASKFASGNSSNICEAVNNEITVIAPKRNNLADSYEWRVNLALLLHNEGPEIKSTILQHLQLPIPSRAAKQQAKRQKRKTYFTNRRKSTDIKSKRAALKEKKKKRGKKITNEEHTYKGGHTPNEEDDGESLTREPKAKRARGDTEHCGCKSANACKNNKCSCVNNNKKCNDKCKCQEKCKNKL